MLAHPGSARRAGLHVLLALAAPAAFVLACESKPDAAGPGAPNAGEVDASSGEPEPLTCKSAGAPTSPGKITATSVQETSGIVQSTRNEGVFWVHNDSGDSARAFAIGPTGKLLATLSFDDATPFDIEDMAIEDVSPDESYLYFGDFGDNDLVRAELTIHRVAEPKLDGKTSLRVTSETMRVTYPDGKHDAETLLFDPTTKDLLIATKADGGPSYVYRVGPFAAGGSAKAKKIAELAVDLATGGEISRDGRRIGIRNYSEKAFVWVRATDESLSDALGRPPCEVRVAKETQGEAFAFLADGTGFVTVSEGQSQALHVSLFE